MKLSEPYSAKCLASSCVCSQKDVLGQPVTGPVGDWVAVGETALNNLGDVDRFDRFSIPISMAAVSAREVVRCSNKHLPHYEDIGGQHSDS
jgi:hypothetical protein